MSNNTMHKRANRLAKEKSPYLLQHAHNPVDWYSWSEEAFEKAKAEDKPIFLSIGYSTCHWCHVMAHESFEDEKVAELMNDTFVSIKVDREERPDIDNIYMTVCQMMTGSGGWPLTIIMTPDKKPFYAATYIPKKSMFGRVGMLEFVPSIKEAWEKDKGRLLESADNVVSHLQNIVDDSEGKGIDRDTLDKAYKEFNRRFDGIKGGFGGAPKFPIPHNLMFLFRYYNLTGEKKALEMALKTLDSMAQGGIFDHVGYGFHRYSTDAAWLLPHFEKMLYDQALIAAAYIEAYQITKDERYSEVAKKVLEYVMRDMTSPYGGFYCAEDADSEGEEGKFYVWSYEELEKLLESNEMNIMVEVFNVKKEGNFRDESTGKQTGLNILHLKENTSDVNREAVEKIRKKLFEVREKRVRPGRDEKILTDWNGLMIAAFSKAYAVFKDNRYLNYARGAADFILDGIDKNGRLMHRAFEKDWSINGNIDDYAFLVYGLIELYEAGFETRYLKNAIDINNEMIRLFMDEKSGGFYFTPSDGEEVIVRTKEIYDGAVPSGNSVAMYNLIRLSRATGDSSLEEIASKENTVFSNEVNSMPSGYTMMLVAASFEIGKSFEIAVVGDGDDEKTKSVIDKLHSEFKPNCVIVLKNNYNKDEIENIAEFTKQYPLGTGKTMVYICTTGMCMNPTDDLDIMMKLLKQ